MTILDVRDLNVVYRANGREIEAVRDLSFTVEKGDSMAVVGESGSGKTTLAMAIMGLLPSQAIVRSGQILLEGQDLVTMPESERRKIRWKKVATVFQASQNALDPVKKVGSQLVELYLYHNRGAKKEEALDRVAKALLTVNLSQSIMNMYPHELSGGMKQRAVIAASLLLEPDVLLADEPTTALDVVTQAEILLLIKRIVSERGLTLLFITHDISLVASLCNRIMVMYGGTDMESGPMRDVLLSPTHPYTQRLMEVLNGLEEGRLTLEQLREDQGRGCPFLSRCRFAESRCAEGLPKRRSLGNREVRCLVRGEG